MYPCVCPKTHLKAQIQNNLIPNACNNKLNNVTNPIRILMRFLTAVIHKGRMICPPKGKDPKYLCAWTMNPKFIWLTKLNITYIFPATISLIIFHSKSYYVPDYAERSWYCEADLKCGSALESASRSSPEAFPVTWQFIRQWGALLTHEIALAGVNVIAWNTLS